MAADRPPDAQPPADAEDGADGGALRAAGSASAPPAPDYSPSRELQKMPSIPTLPPDTPKSGEVQSRDAIFEQPPDMLEWTAGSGQIGTPSLGETLRSLPSPLASHAPGASLSGEAQPGEELALRIRRKGSNTSLGSKGSNSGGRKDRPTSSSSNRPASASNNRPGTGNSKDRPGTGNSKDRPGTGNSKGSGRIMALPRPQSPGQVSSGQLSSLQLAQLTEPKTSTSRASFDSGNQQEWYSSMGSTLTSDTNELQEDGKMDVNQPGILPFSCLTVTWVACCAATLLATILVYAYEEVRKLEAQAVELGVVHARFHASEVLAPAVAVTRAVDTAFRAGDVTSLSDYEGLARILQPHFQSYGYLRKVELVDGSLPFNGSLLITPRHSGGVEVRTDRSDCWAVPGSRGCALRSLGVNHSGWYRASQGIADFWDGPYFAHDSPHEASCEELCWTQSYSYVARIMGGMVPPPGEERPPALLVRAVVDTHALQAVARKVEELSNGKAVLCTEKGEVVATSDMRQAIYVAPDTGLVRSAYVWEVGQPWAEAVGADFVRRARVGRELTAGGSRISVWTLDGTSNATQGLKDHARLVLALPNEAVIDDVIGPLVVLGIVESVVPAVVIIIGTVIAAYLKCCRKRQFSIPHMPGASGQ